MQTEIQLILSPQQAQDHTHINQAIATALSIPPHTITDYQIIRKSIDSRSKQTKINMVLRAYIGEEKPKETIQEISYTNVSKKPSVIVVGAGPAGLFAALKLLQLGIKPIVLERGKDVKKRKIDIANINRNKAFDNNSNYCFGEGGAGTFSDGKLYTRSKKKGNVREILETFYRYGATENILYESHPHIGSDKLPIIIENIRNTILQYGGEYHFDQQVVSFLIENNTIKGCKTHDEKTYQASALILATGHSARDMYHILNQQGIALEAKGFAMGVRVEHPQALINQIQYHTQADNPHLPAATYRLVEQVEGRGVYSFCMCPGGHIVPAGSSEQEIVVNGMSASQRNSPYANSGIVVEIRPEDLPDTFKQYGTMAGLKFQEHVETLAFRNNGGKGRVAPAQGLVDFVNNRLSDKLPTCSYLPGVVSSPLHFWLPDIICHRLQKAFPLFDQKMKGFLTNQALIVGVETRSSSPIRIPRDRHTHQHPQIQGLFPAGEGAGYAGGISSSSIDGINVAKKVAEYVQ